MAQNKLFSRTELLACLLTGLMALILGSWAIVVSAAIGGLLIGFAAENNRAGVVRAVIFGFIAALVTVLAGYVHNEWVSQLPVQEEIDPNGKQVIVYLAALALGTLVAFLIAVFRASANEGVRKWGVLAVLAVLAVAFPFFDSRTGALWMATVITALIYTLQASGLNIVAGFSGMLDLGYVAFFAIGGYTVAFLRSNQLFTSDTQWWTFWVVIFVAALAAAIFGLILGAPVIPLRGDYLAIVTLGFGEIVPIVFKNLEAVRINEPISMFTAWLTGDPTRVRCWVGCESALNVTNGTQGISPIGVPDLPAGLVAAAKSLGLDIAFRVDNYTPWYFLILGLVVVSVYFISQVRRSRIGRSMVAMSEDELAASSMGVPLTRTKLTAFMVGAMFSGFAGAFYGSRVGFIGPDSFDFSVSVIVLCMVILGGSGSISGVILGSLVIMIVDRLMLDKLQIVINGILRATVFVWNTNPGLNNFLEGIFNMTQYKLILFGLILVIMMITRPQGLIPASIIKYKENK
jgi:branched-chain amino acid transport system permease protein